MQNRYLDGTYLAQNPGWHTQDGFWKLTHVKRALKRAQLPDIIETVCDIGCGSGELLRRWAEEEPGVSFWGYEPSPQAFGLCLQKKPDNVEFVLSATPEKGKTFDLALALDVLEHVPSPQELLETLKQSAPRIILHVPLEKNLRTFLSPSLLERERRMVGHLHFYTWFSLKKLLQDSGLRVVGKHYTHKYLERPPVLKNVRSQVGMFIRKTVHFLLPRSWAALTVGGYSVMLVLERED